MKSKQGGHVPYRPATEPWMEGGYFVACDSRGLKTVFRVDEAAGRLCRIERLDDAVQVLRTLPCVTEPEAPITLVDEAGGFWSLRSDGSLSPDL